MHGACFSRCESNQQSASPHRGRPNHIAKAADSLLKQICVYARLPMVDCRTYLQVVEGNLCTQRVSAIVNPTNNQLALTGGVSKHIAKAVGLAQLERSCMDLLNKQPAGQRSVVTGSARVTRCKGYGLSTPFEFIVHAVGPHYNGGLLSSTCLALPLYTVGTLSPPSPPPPIQCRGTPL